MPAKPSAKFATPSLICINTADTAEKTAQIMRFLCRTCDNDEDIDPGMLLMLNQVREAVEHLRDEIPAQAPAK